MAVPLSVSEEIDKPPYSILPKARFTPLTASISSITEVSSPAAAVTDTSPAHGANAGIPWPRKTTRT